MKQQIRTRNRANLKFTFIKTKLLGLYEDVRPFIDLAYQKADRNAKTQLTIGYLICSTCGNSIFVSMNHSYHIRDMSKRFQCSGRAKH